jgi:hypothetical protein
LAFVKTSSINETKEIRPIEGSPIKILMYDQQHRYTFVPNMKAGDMLVFKGSDVIHGSLNLVEHQGLRKSLAMLVMFDKDEYDIDDKDDKNDQDSDVKDNDSSASWLSSLSGFWLLALFLL